MWFCMQHVFTALWQVCVLGTSFMYYQVYQLFAVLGTEERTHIGRGWIFIGNRKWKKPKRTIVIFLGNLWNMFAFWLKKVHLRFLFSENHTKKCGFVLVLCSHISWLYFAKNRFFESLHPIQLVAWTFILSECDNSCFAPLKNATVVNTGLKPFDIQEPIPNIHGLFKTARVTLSSAGVNLSITFHSLSYHQLQGILWTSHPSCFKNNFATAVKWLGNCNISRAWASDQFTFRPTKCAQQCYFDWQAV